MLYLKSHSWTVLHFGNHDISMHIIHTYKNLVYTHRQFMYMIHIYSVMQDTPL